MVKSVMGPMSPQTPGGWTPEDSSIILKERRSGSLWRSLEDPEVEELSMEEELVKTDWTLPQEAFCVRPDTGPITPTSQSDDGNFFHLILNCCLSNHFKKNYEFKVYF